MYETLNITNMKRNIIAEGNYCKTSYFATNGTAEYHIGVKDNAEDEYQIVYEDGLYKLFKNGDLQMAATSALIKVTDWTGLKNH